MSSDWDAIVIGAGPAGAMAAMQIARRGHRTLLVEAKRFPRDKVCGGCLNRRAWAVLESADLDQRLLNAGAIELNRLQLICGGAEANWPMPSMHAISRRTMDQLLVQAATEQGVTCLMETQARVIGRPAATSGKSENELATVTLRTRSSQVETVRAKIVIAADGLTHSSLSAIDEVKNQPQTASRVGIGATFSIDHPTACEQFPIGQLTMVAGQDGYVGITRVEAEQLNMAAAIAPERLRSAASPQAAISELLREGNVAVPPECLAANWTGTAGLTRESNVWAGHRLFLVGDAAGYVEPFTGEGMSWALSGAMAVSQFADRAIEHWHEDMAQHWHKHWRTTVRSHQVTCRALAWLLRKPRLAGLTLRTVSHAPWVARWVMQRVAGPPLVARSTGAALRLGNEV